MSIRSAVENVEISIWSTVMHDGLDSAEADALIESEILKINS